MCPSGGDQRSAPVRTDEVAAQLLMTHAPALVALVDADGRVVDVYGALLERLGLARADCLGRSVDELLPDAAADEIVARGLAGHAFARTIGYAGRRWMCAVQPAVIPSGTGFAAVVSFADEVDVHQALTESEADLERFAALVQLSNDFIAMADLEGRLVFLNRAGADLVGMADASEGLGLSPLDFFPEEEMDTARGALETLVTEGSWQGESAVRHWGTGEAIPVWLNSFVVTRASDGRRLALAAVVRDLREQRAAEQALALRAQEQRDLAELGQMALVQPLSELMRECVRRLQQRFPGMVAGVMVREEGLRFRTLASGDPTWENRVTTFSGGSLTGAVMAHGRVQHSSDMWSDPRYDSELAQASQMRAGLVVAIPGRGTAWGTLGISASEPHSWTSDEVAFAESLAATLGAAVQRSELETELQHQALHDGLTGLPNRALVVDRIDSALGRSRRTGGLLAVLLLDLDDFKAVNDTLGHAAGDRLLCELSERFQDAVRAGDSVARLGGDEFVVLCEEPASEDEVALLADALLAACADALVLDGRPVSVTVSLGIALSVAGDSDATRLLAEADMAMYRAKRDRPGSYRLFDEAMRGDVLGRVNIASRLRSAVRAGDLSLVYQPIVSLETGSVVAFEALARWQTDGVTVPPDQFVPVAEETGLIGELGAWVLGEALHSSASWRAAGHEVGLRVNVSAHELRSRSYVDDVLAALADHGVPPGLLGLEITESTLVDDDRTQDNLARLTEAGVCLLVDDFGTGYSSLSYLEQFPVVDVLKVDKSFLREGTRGLAVVQAVMGLARAFGFEVCAEGVETAEQLAFLEELGCQLAQGYFLARPMPPEQVEEFLRTWRSPLDG